MRSKKLSGNSSESFYIFYKFLIASIGFNLIIFLIGIKAASNSRPKEATIRVINVKISILKNGAVKALIGELKYLLNIADATNIATTLNTNVTADIKNVSIKNILVKSLFVAPIADKIPISFLRFIMLKEMRFITSNNRIKDNTVAIVRNIILKSEISDSNAYTTGA